LQKITFDSLESANKFFVVVSLAFISKFGRFVCLDTDPCYLHMIAKPQQKLWFKTLVILLLSALCTIAPPTHIVGRPD